MPVLPGSALAGPCWSLAHGRLNPFRCRVELSAVTRLEHEVDCAGGCRRIDILQPCPVGSPPPTGPGGARRSHDHRTDQRHPVKSFPIGAPMPVSPTRAQARSAESVDQADDERHERPDCATRNEPASRAAPCRRPYRPGCRADRLTRSRAPGLMPMPSARMRPAAISPSWCTAAGGTPERDDDDSDGDLHGSRRHAAPASGSTIEHLGRRSASISPVTGRDRRQPDS